MDSKERDELCDTGPEEETGARQKNRSRRVSFAEITSVHFFDRDDSDSSGPAKQNEHLGFQSDVGGSDEWKELVQNEEDEDDNDDERRAFVGDPYSSSPGSAIGSATSNDEEDFFGPVSASFIRSGHTSDSAASDDKHDITLDSTAFSMHFRSLAQSVSEGDLKTPSRHHLASEERTPSETSVPTNQSNCMALTGIKKILPHCSVSDGKFSGTSESNDMSLVEENPHRYDYARLSPTLGALLAEGSKGLHGISVSNDAEITSPSNCHSDSRFKDLKDSRSEELYNIVTNDMPVEVISGGSIKSWDGSARYATPPVYQISHDCSSSSKHAQPADVSVGDSCQIFLESQKEMPLYKEEALGSNALEASGLISEVGTFTNTTSKPPSKTLDVNLNTDHDCGFLGGPRALSGEGLAGDGNLTPTTLQISDQQNGSPTAGSVSSLRAKRKQLFCDGTVSPGSEQFSIRVGQKRCSSSLKNDERGDGENGSSIEKTISKLDFLNNPVVVKDGFDYSKPTFSGYNCKLVSQPTALSENTENLWPRKVEISATVLEDRSLCSVQKNSEQIDTVTVDAQVSESSNIISMLGQAENDIYVVHNAELEEQISDNMFYTDQPSKVMAVAVPPQFSSSGKQIQEHSLASHDTVKGTFITSKPGSLLIDTTEDINLKKQLIVASGKFSESPKHSGILSKALKQQDQRNKLLSSSSKHDVTDSGVIVTSASHLTPITRKDVNYLTPGAGGFGSFLKEKRSQAVSPIIGNNSRDSLNLAELEGLCDNQLFNNQQSESGNIMDCKTPLQLQVALSSQSRSLVQNNQAVTDFSMFRNRLSDEELKEFSYDPASLSMLENATATQVQKVLVDQMTETPSLEKAFNFPHTDRMQHSVGKDSPKLVSYSNQKNHSSSPQDLHILLQSIPACVENHERKRKSEDFVLMENIRVEETGKAQKSPKILEMDGSVPQFSSEHLIVRENVVHRNQVDRPPKLSSDVFSKLYGALKEQLSESSHGLKWQLHILEDMLDQLQKVKKYEKLCAVIQFQPKRVAEARCLQQMLVYEQAKLQLMRVKHEIMQRRLHMLQTGIQEVQNLKSCSLHHLSMASVRGAEDKGFVNGKNKEAANKVIKMKQEIGDLDEKTKSIIERFSDSCHIKGDLSHDESIVMVKDHLKNRTSCSNLCQDLQLWSIDDLGKESGCHNITLNYCNFLFQRLTITVHPISSIVVVNKLIDTNIIKAFPGINACTAFTFVFNAEAADKGSSSKCLAEETQITSSLLGNLLDVIEEVLAARIDLPDLFQTSFYSSCAKQLNLRLCFIHFKTGLKVILILDMTYLNCGVYPSDVVPAHVLTNTNGVETPISPSSSLSHDITVAVAKLKAGHARISRLCRCISQVIQAWSV